MPDPLADWRADGPIASLLARLADPDATPLMEQWEDILTEDNRAGVLAGTDKDGNPLAPLAASTLKNRQGDGPPLAPRGAASRVITHFRTGHGRIGSDWFVVGAWEAVVSAKGVPFLPFHFEGQGYLPKRDLAGVRPEGRRKAQEALKAWVNRLVKGATS